MLKGHTKIELTNVWTGKVEVHEHNNLVTNAVQNQLNALAQSYGRTMLNSEYFPLHENGMGGIVLFQNQLEESIDNVSMPTEKDNPVIGYASNAVNEGTDTKRGSKNLTESQKLEKGYKYVWDFATSQANGEISALALTHTGAGENPFGTNLLGQYDWIQLASIHNNVYDTSDNGILAQYFSNAVEFDWNTCTLTCILSTSATTISVRKYRIPLGLDGMGINDVLSGVKLLSEQTITFATSLSEYLRWLDGRDGYYYGVVAVNNEPLKIVRIFKDDYSFDEDYGIKSTITFGSNAYLRHYPNCIYCEGACVIDDGYLYVSAKGSTMLLKINLTDLSYTEATMTSQNTPGMCMHNGIIHAGTVFVNKDLSMNSRSSADAFYPVDYSRNMNSEQIFIRNDGVVLNLYVNNNGSYSSSSSYNYLCIAVGNLRNYLATVNNLGAPIIKTAAQTMKITYTITDEEE